MLRPALALLLTGAIGVAAPAAPRDISDEAQVAKRLQGLVPSGPVQDCVNPQRNGGAEAHYGNTLLVKDRGGTLYRSQFQRGCEAPQQFALITRRPGTTRLCRGDIAEVEDLISGISRGACVIGEFVPYRRP